MNNLLNNEIFWQGVSDGIEKIAANAQTVIAKKILASGKSMEEAVRASGLSSARVEQIAGHAKLQNEIQEVGTKANEVKNFYSNAKRPGALKNRDNKLDNLRIKKEQLRQRQRDLRSISTPEHLVNHPLPVLKKRPPVQLSGEQRLALETKFKQQKSQMQERAVTNATNASKGNNTQVGGNNTQVGGNNTPPKNFSDYWKDSKKWMKNNPVSTAALGTAAVGGIGLAGYSMGNKQASLEKVAISGLKGLEAGVKRIDSVEKGVGSPLNVLLGERTKKQLEYIRDKTKNSVVRDLLIQHNPGYRADMLSKGEEIWGSKLLDFKNDVATLKDPDSAISAIFSSNKLSTDEKLIAAQKIKNAVRQVKKPL